MKTSILLACMVLTLLFISACDRATGGGRLDGVNGQASFGFNADGCDFPAFKGQIQYGAKDGGQKFHGEANYARQCLVGGDCPVCDPLRISLGFPLTLGDYEVGINYDSTNPAIPGSGTATLCVTDNGEGVNSAGADTGIISVSSGPYAGYLNYGEIRGNIQQHKCN